MPDTSRPHTSEPESPGERASHPDTTHPHTSEPKIPQPAEQPTGKPSQAEGDDGDAGEH